MNEEMLRRALVERASQVSASPDALDEIRRRVAGRHPGFLRSRFDLRSVWPRWLRGGPMFWSGTFGATAVTATVVAVVASVGSCNPAPTTVPTPAGSSVSTTPAQP